MQVLLDRDRGLIMHKFILGVLATSEVRCDQSLQLQVRIRTFVQVELVS
jgi:hypothetical protein